MSKKIKNDPDRVSVVSGNSTRVQELVREIKKLYQKERDPNTMASLIMNAVEHGNWTEVYLWSQELAGYARTRARAEFDMVFGENEGELT
jgi:hypothetical protein